MLPVSKFRWSWLLLGLSVCVMPLRAEDAPLSFPVIPPPGYGTESELTKDDTRIAETLTRLRELAEKSTDPLFRGELRLGAVNVILSEQLELACTKRFWSLPGADVAPLPAESLRAAFDSAEELLNDAKSDLTAARDALSESGAGGSGGDEADEDPNEEENDSVMKRYSHASSARRTLQAFHQALQVVLLPPDGEDAERSARRVSSELSALMENDDSRVSASANFWQAFLRRGESDASGALTRLSYALDDVLPPSRPYAFFSRVLRCLVLNEHGRRIAAVTLLTQMEERIFGWFADDAEREQAMRGIIWTRVHILRQWHDSLDPKTQEAERRWCRERATKLIEDKLSGPMVLPRLQPTIPFLMDPEKLEARGAGSD